MRGWAITINDRRGLDALATTEVEALREKHKDVTISTVLPIEIVNMILSLEVANLAALFGIEISERDTALTRVAFSDLGTVIGEISGLDRYPHWSRSRRRP